MPLPPLCSYQQRRTMRFARGQTFPPRKISPLPLYDFMRNLSLNFQNSGLFQEKPEFLYSEIFQV